MKRFLIAALTISASFTLIPAAASAQEMSSAEIRAKLLAQIEKGSGSAAVSDVSRGIMVDDGDLASEPQVYAAPAAPERESGVSHVSVRQPQPPTPVSLPNYDEQEKINLLVMFEFDSAYIRRESYRQLAALCDAVSGLPRGVEFVVIGHTDASGSASYNLGLSKRRAEEVKRYMEAECQVPNSQLRAVGAGEQLLREGYGELADEQRRVEIAVDS